MKAAKSTLFQPDPIEEARRCINSFLASHTELPDTKFTELENAFRRLHPTEIATTYLQLLKDKLRQLLKGKAGENFFKQMEQILNHATAIVERFNATNAPATHDHQTAPAPR